jgi:Putative adhesin
VTIIAPPPPAPATPPPAGPAIQPPPPLSPGGRTAVRVTLIVAAAVLVVGTVATLGTMAWGVSSYRVITDTKQLPTAMRSLVVDTGSVPVAVRITTDRDAREPRADLRMVNSTRAGANPLVVNVDGANVRVTISSERSMFMDWGRAGEITLVLPPELARRLTVTTQQDNGIVLAQAGLDQLIARTDNGEVILSGSARRIEINTDNGDVVTRDPISVSESFSVNTDNGNIKVDFSDAAPRTVDATSDNGDVIVALPAPGPYVVNASTENGDTTVLVPEVTDRENATSVVTARSQNGDVIIDDLR